MSEIPTYLLKRPRRLLQADHSTEVSLANENSTSGSTVDGDFKQLKKIREVNCVCKGLCIYLLVKL